MKHVRHALTLIRARRQPSIYADALQQCMFRGQGRSKEIKGTMQARNSYMKAGAFGSMALDSVPTEMDAQTLAAFEQIQRILLVVPAIFTLLETVIFFSLLRWRESRRGGRAVRASRRSLDHCVTVTARLAPSETM
ncbi:MAG TPA: hypothetical protein VFN10_06965 [Thermoanaerobaculia bacterium]|nr:hypothetical protein [Thermoanaerobaculia bacterium]